MYVRSLWQFWYHKPIIMSCNRINELWSYLTCASPWQPPHCSSQCTVLHVHPKLEYHQYVCVGKLYAHIIDCTSTLKGEWVSLHRLRAHPRQWRNKRLHNVCLLLPEEHVPPCSEPSQVGAIRGVDQEGDGGLNRGQGGKLSPRLTGCGRHLAYSAVVQQVETMRWLTL